MKKLTITFLAIVFSIGAAFSQPVSDMGIIPIGVTLNSILRLNIVSGGNIEFVVNSIDQYTLGVGPDALYETNFTVSSSIDFDVLLYAENANLTGVDNAANLMLVDNIGYVVREDGTGVEPTAWVIPTIGGTAADVEALTNNPLTQIIQGVDNAAAGDILKNDFTIEWELGTVHGTMNGQSLLVQSLPADRYVVNAFLVLQSN